MSTNHTEEDLSRSRVAAADAGIEPGFTYRTGSNGTPYEGFADLPGGERVYAGVRMAKALDASEAAELLAGRLAAELSIPTGKREAAEYVKAGAA